MTFIKKIYKKIKKTNNEEELKNPYGKYLKEEETGEVNISQNLKVIVCYFEKGITLSLVQNGGSIFSRFYPNKIKVVK